MIDTILETLKITLRLKEESFQDVMDSLASDFSTPEGPQYTSSSNHTTWVRLRASVETYKGALRRLTKEDPAYLIGDFKASLKELEVQLGINVAILANPKILSSTHLMKLLHEWNTLKSSIDAYNDVIKRLDSIGVAE